MSIFDQPKTKKHLAPFEVKEDLSIWEMQEMVRLWIKWGHTFEEQLHMADKFFGADMVEDVKKYLLEQGFTPLDTTTEEPPDPNQAELALEFKI